MTEPKPAHLGPAYAAQFEDETIASAYHTRPPYPPALFERLGRLQPARGRILDLGCGTGDIALGLLNYAERVDALDPSAAMLRIARSRPSASDPRVRWIESSAETFQPDASYSLIVAAESLHWMDWPVVIRWISRALDPSASLALVSGRRFDPLPWDHELGSIIARYSTNKEYRPYDLVEELTARRLFRETGRTSTPPIPFAQSLDEYIESFHTRNGLSRQRMTRDAATHFDAAVRSLVSRTSHDTAVHGTLTATAIWGTPLAA